METQEHAPRLKTSNFRVVWPIAGSVIIGMALIFLLFSLLNEYSDRMIGNQKATYANIVRNIAISIENEVSQTEQSLQFFVNTKDFNDALVTFTDEKMSWPLNQISLLFCVYYSQVIENMLISTNNQLSSTFWSLKQKTYTKASLVSTNEFATMNIYVTDEHPKHTYLGITVSNTKGYYVTAMLDMDLMYQRLVSHIQIDRGTDILVKNSDGLIVMSSDQFVIGEDAGNVYQNLMAGKKGNPNELLDIIAHQAQQIEGSETFSGFWLYDHGQEASKKLSVYVPANVDAGFLIISAIIDYDEVLRPVQTMFVKVSALVVAISLVFIGLIVFLYYAGRRKEEMEKENRYLRELNRTLQLVNENQRMENHQQRLEIIGTMTCGIAHEFNNLLTPIMGYSGMLLAQKTEEDPEYDDVKEIFEASDKAKQIIQQISAFGRKNSDMTFHHIPVQGFFTQLQKLAAGLMPASVLFTCIPPEDEQYIFGNATQLTQVVLNLIVNGVEAIGKQEGHITLSFHADPELCDQLDIDLPSDKTKHFACIKVADDGCGMDNETEQQIFKPFFTTKAKQGGSGLGLLISENIIHAHHGKILVTSKAGEGSSFTIVLPLSEKPNTQVPEMTIQSLQQESPQKLEILIVDEELIALRLYAKGLAKRGYEVAKAQESSLALEALQQFPYNVLVIDDAIKEMPWPELAMKARQILPNLTTILMTALISKDVIEAVSTGILDGYVLKPSLVSELEDEILDVLKF